MSQELITQSAQASTAMALSSHGALHGAANVGAVEIESQRAIAAVRGQIQVAQMFPRDVAAARRELMDECDVLEFAQVAFYAVPRAGGTVTGPSIRLAEACATAYGHMEWGHIELSRGEGKSEVEVFAWDKQKNNLRKRQITVDHYRDTKNGPVKLRDSKDIDDKIANVASKQMRGAILAIVPKSFVAAAEARCRATLNGGGGVPLKQRIDKMTDAFAKFGVSAEILKKHLGKPLDEINGDDITDLTAIFNAIKGGDKIADHFGGDDDAAETNQTGAALAATADAAKAAPKADPKPKGAGKTVQKDSKPTEEPAATKEVVTEQKADDPQPTTKEAQGTQPADTDSEQDQQPDPTPETSVAGPEGEDVF